MVVNHDSVGHDHDIPYRDRLVPDYHSATRRSTLFPATFNLIATIIGGGVLSLPWAFSQCGIVWATFLMGISATVTDRSLWILCLSARRSGAASYGEVARHGLGETAEVLVAALLVIFLLFVVTAYMVLIRDIWSPILLSLIRASSEFEEDRHEGNLVLAVLVGLLMPFVLQRELHALRFNCYMGFASIAVLCVALCIEAITTNHHNPTEWTIDATGSPSFSLQQHSHGISHVLVAMPIITLAFVSHFNIIPIQNALVDPSRPRIQSLIGSAVGACCFLMYLFGLAGYWCFRDTSEGNILLNLQEENNVWVAAGRIGCGITILFAVPMMVLPCRRNLLELVDCYIEFRYRDSLDAYHNNADNNAAHEETQLLSLPADRYQSSLESRDHISENLWAHTISTLLIVCTCYVGAVAAPGVAVVLSLCGSGMAFLIAFILPCTCYLRIAQKYSELPREPVQTLMFAWVLLVVSTLAAVACTVQTLLHLL
jgi:amino acid permease